MKKVWEMTNEEKELYILKLRSEYPDMSPEAADIIRNTVRPVIEDIEWAMNSVEDGYE